MLGRHCSKLYTFIKKFLICHAHKYHIFNSDIRPCNTFIPRPPKNQPSPGVYLCWCRHELAFNLCIFCSLSLSCSAWCWWLDGCPTFLSFLLSLLARLLAGGNDSMVVTPCISEYIYRVFQPVLTGWWLVVMTGCYAGDKMVVCCCCLWLTPCQPETSISSTCRM